MDNCDPAAAFQRRLAAARAEADAYAAKAREELRMETGMYKTGAENLDKLRTSAVGLYTTLRDAEVELYETRLKARNYEQLERRERRAFLDSAPQSGVGGVPGVRTSDDKVLLAFWITYGAAIVVGTILLLNMYGDKAGLTDTPKKVAAGAFALAVAYTIAYPLISFYG
jgi:hypothetical protein